METMNRRDIIKLSALATAGSLLPNRPAAADGAGRLATPSPAQQRWHDMELGMFFHFDIPVFKQGWNWRSYKDLPDPDIYQPKKLDTDQWLEAAKAMGAKYAIFVAKHCSGFLQWQSDVYPYGLKQSSWRGGKGDVVGDFVASCRKCGIRPGIYASVSANAYLEVDRGLTSRGKGGDPDAQKKYARICERMAEELWTKYGELFEIWFDGGAIPASKGGPDLVPLLEKHQPESIVFQGPPGTPNLIRWVGNEKGVAPYPCWSTVDQGSDSGGGNPDGRLWAPGECDVPVRNHDWFWKPNRANRLYSLEELVEMYYRSVGRNCNLLLNANPNPSGLVPEADFRRYAEFGKEIKRRFAHPLARTKGPGKTVELSLPGRTEIDHVVIMEDIARGERVRGYKVEAFGRDGSWKPVCDGISIGHKRIERFAPITTEKIRLVVTAQAAEPLIRELAVYQVGAKGQ